MSTSVVIAGSLALDWVFTPQGMLHRMVCGGNALYAAAGALIWSNSLAIVSRAGLDFPLNLLSVFGERGVDLSGVKVIDCPHDILTGYRYDENGERIFLNIPDEFARLGLRPESDLEAHFLGLDWNALDSPVLNTISEDISEAFWAAQAFSLNASAYTVQVGMIQAYEQRGMPFALDPGWPLNVDRLPLLKKVPIYLPSHCDVGAYLDILLRSGSAEWMQSLGPDVIGVKLGARGSMIYDTGTRRRYLIPAVPTVVRDPTGAGDAYVGAFTAAWVETGDVLESALRAAVASSFVVEHFDVRSCLAIDPDEARKRLSTLRNRIEIVTLSS